MNTFASCTTHNPIHVGGYSAHRLQHNTITAFTGGAQTQGLLHNVHRRLVPDNNPDRTTVAAAAAAAAHKSFWAVLVIFSPQTATATKR